METKIVKNILSSVIPIALPVIGTYGIITFYKQKKAKKRAEIRLQHINQYENQGYVINNYSQIVNKYNSIPINHRIDYTNKEIVKHFMEQFERSLGNDIRLARHNFSTLRLEKTKDILKTGASGVYEGTENIIKYINNNSIILGHEMLHMASYMYDNVNDVHHHGFMQQKGDVKIGTGLNEGYTELMNSRLFNDGKVNSYKRLVRIVKLIEEFFPNPQILSHYYFTCNLPSFIHDLGRYCTRTELKEIIYGLDKLYEYENIPGSPIAISLETQLATKLFKIYERNFIREPEKIKAFKQKASENKLTAMVIAGKNMRTTRTNPFTRIKDGIKNGFRKVKNFFTGNQQPPPQPAYTR